MLERMQWLPIQVLWEKEWMQEHKKSSFKEKKISEEIIKGKMPLKTATKG